MDTIIFFDIDSTLVMNRFSQRVVRDVLTEIATATGQSVAELSRELGAENSRRQVDDPDNVLTMDWHDIATTIAAQYDHVLSANVDELWLQYANSADVEVLDDAPSVLQQLQHGRKLVIATKGLSKYQNPVLAVSGLDGYFDDMLTPDITGYLKTSPQYFNTYRHTDALFIHVGDHFYDDVICAKRNGFYSVMRAPITELAAVDPFERPQQLDPYLGQIETYPDEGSNVRPDAVVLSLQEVPTVIAQIEAQHQN